ncbi:hypothetical protein APR48_27445 [Variovorax paradoxus]|nr:hypothetical protein APR52_37325 [Variovorax paradoxus]KPV04104.1 hypothetical protein APR49_25065 [Variovorax paradoxus]KPV17927.1 hypothetical protein APR51_25295 [Variovorax paradoxus]KPV27766.1 hypothetical protein APR48_27445 [Variovorax paradoxus]KPV29628.1 hypothetical protein APR47_25840 [Variovorax paradoxus]
MARRRVRSQVILSSPHAMSESEIQPAARSAPRIVRVMAAAVFARHDAPAARCGVGMAHPIGR